MRPTSTTLSLLAIVALAAPAVAQGPASRAAAASAATQALPLAEPPAAKIVPASAGGPVSTAERLLADEDLLAASADVPDEPAVAEEIDKESAELEDLRRAEEASHVQEKSTVPPHQPGVGRIALLPELDHDLAQLQAEYDIPIEVNEAVVGYIRFFQSRVARGHFVKWLGRSHRYMDRYRAILKEEGIPQDTVFLAMIESGFGNFAYSRARASGPWQFIGPTGKMFGLKQDFWVDERRDPEKSAHAAARYLKQLHDQTGDWRLAWAGYNAGVGRIFKAKAKGYDDFWEMAAVPGRKVLRTETKGYVPKLMAAAIVTKHPEAFGFRAAEIDRQRWDEYTEVMIPSATLLAVVARAAAATERELMDLNPELRRACTPPRPYKLKIPKGQAEAFAQNWPALQGKVRMTFAGHVVRRGDTLSSIARSYGVPTEGIMEMNGLRTAKKLRIGQELIIPKPTGGGQLAAARAPEPSASPRRPVKAKPSAEEPAAKAEPARQEPSAAPRVAAAPSAAASAAARSRTTLRVQPGDSLWSISRRLGVELLELCRWNGIENPRRHKLLVGAQLVVYADRG
ncbi:MAG TPA: LysM peptidoglycan-binding domain-containing protein [Anaeromyxobacter sp.]